MKIKFFIFLIFSSNSLIKTAENNNHVKDDAEETITSEEEAEMLRFAREEMASVSNLTPEQETELFRKANQTLIQMRQKFLADFNSKLKILSEMEPSFDKYMGLVKLYYDTEISRRCSVSATEFHEQNSNAKAYLKILKDDYIDKEQDQDKKRKMLEKYDQIGIFFSF